MKQSLFRKLTNQILAKQELSGEILDLGGKKKSGYHGFFKGDFKITVANLDPQTQPDLLIDLEKIPWLIADGRYDAILLINVLEHLYDFKKVLAEALRILKEKGEVIAVVPFLFYLHPSPRDYFRFTSLALEKLFIESGFKEIEIKEVGSGALSCVFNLLHRFFPEFLIGITGKICIFLDDVLKTLAVLLNRKYSGKEYPLGYFLRAKKL